MGFPHCLLCVALACLSFSIVGSRGIMLWQLSGLEALFD
ncbi:hypothetical protein EV11_1188 [Prochlorococcus sp. SS52]|uniref:Uncharacterized protein n=1 Tax=Prochlorococcus marinus (strain SARG / CCMP1375 / SS120) TaxID=167539 RepID=Q7VB92_PROMA|nr:Predicted protein [Prochlorococcus marinus subsp. marinus str. CCMP1375]KGG14054.1 hypothetical protein EV04_0539 [Prochlorococcus marinus str. LG]KGG19187.1 hypothetical protein EV08_1674 [Prochlorococcus marinus str. SS2]KGG25178.1 hypothetical protein EV09_0072 [Prochlorococcus marinus str. SS35]KGG32492.1 hypothetical protein EV10_1607 [Prochlorococcus marinus str. SS51]KGG35624.1 hypothetical protein EV11_1188 [Prochlorococcus sp. SS52]